MIEPTVAHFETDTYLVYIAFQKHTSLLHKDSRNLSLKTFYSRAFRQTLPLREVVKKILPFSEELRYYYDLYQLLLFHFQEKQASHFFDLIEEHLDTMNKECHTVFKSFLRYKDYIINALELPYSNAKLEATNKLIKDIKRQAFGFRKFKNFKTKILIALNTKRVRGVTLLGCLSKTGKRQIERTGTTLSRC
ncbi:hypothetical protein C0J00_00660 [Streptococcus pluranimalium]|uniref:Transposase IS204/IS1001/IS1096/IS1165 DDE domain-containing protein n=1 Tax=Streptococcus pluranimalium TaxID=82348 RepID=A0A2L0D1U1_9STRE|nr:hypothetical protein C0J00_00660 [Streptococcus pluranimalium]